MIEEKPPKKKDSLAKNSKASKKSAQKQQAKADNADDAKERRGRGRPRKVQATQDLEINDDPRIQYENGVITIEKKYLEAIEQPSPDDIGQVQQAIQKPSLTLKKSVSKASAKEKSVRLGKRKSQRKSECIDEDLVIEE